MAPLAEEPMKGRPMEQSGIQTGSCTFEKADTRIGALNMGENKVRYPLARTQKTSHSGDVQETSHSGAPVLAPEIVSLLPAWEKCNHTVVQ